MPALGGKADMAIVIARCPLVTQSGHALTVTGRQPQGAR